MSKTMPPARVPAIECGHKPQFQRQQAPLVSLHRRGFPDPLSRSHGSGRPVNDYSKGQCFVQWYEFEETCASRAVHLIRDATFVLKPLQGLSNWNIRYFQLLTKTESSNLAVLNHEVRRYKKYQRIAGLSSSSNELIYLVRPSDFFSILETLLKPKSRYSSSPWLISVSLLIQQSFNNRS